MWNFLKNDKILPLHSNLEISKPYRLEKWSTLWSLSNTAPYSRYQLKYMADSACHGFAETKQLRLIIENDDSTSAPGLADLFDFDPFQQPHRLEFWLMPHHEKGVALSAMNLLIEYAFRVSQAPSGLCPISRWQQSQHR